MRHVRTSVRPTRRARSAAKPGPQQQRDGRSSPVLPRESPPFETSRGSGTGPVARRGRPCLVDRGSPGHSRPPTSHRCGNGASSRVIELDHSEAGAVLALHELRPRDRAWRPTQPLLYKQNNARDVKKSSAVCAYNRDCPDPVSPAPPRPPGRRAATQRPAPASRPSCTPTARPPECTRSTTQSKGAPRHSGFGHQFCTLFRPGPRGGRDRVGRRCRTARQRRVRRDAGVDTGPTRRAPPSETSGCSTTERLRRHSDQLMSMQRPSLRRSGVLSSCSNSGAVSRRWADTTKSVLAPPTGTP